MKLENKRAAISDLNFKFDDTGDLLDGVIDENPITIRVVNFRMTIRCLG